jgi:Family of unknown function (DUF6788)
MQTIFGCFCCFSWKLALRCDSFHLLGMKDKITQLAAARKQLIEQMPDPASVLPGSLLSRMVRCNKPGCRYCEKDKGKGHGPIWILSVSLGKQRVRQIPIPRQMKKEVEEGLRAFARLQKLLKQIAGLNVELLKERKQRR